jgi:hypothetical protein
VSGSVQQGIVKLGAKVCRYYASATLAIRLENETIKGVRLDLFDNCPISIRKQISPNWEVASQFSFINTNDSVGLKRVFSQIEPAGAFFLASALRYLS